MSDNLRDRQAFADRLRLQLESRYRAMTVTVEPERFAVLVRGSGFDGRLPLGPLQADCLRNPRQAPDLIAGWVRSIERQLTSTAPLQFATERLLWCVRPRAAVTALSRAGDLLTVDVGSEMFAFVSEALPGSFMRGVPRQEWESRGLDDAAVSDAATEHTRQRFDALPQRIRALERVPADGWRFSGDSLFQGSVVMVADVLAALVERAGGDVLLAVPDRTLALALPADSARAEAFARRVTQAFREAMTPCSSGLLITNGATVRSLPRARGRRPTPDLMAWLRD